MDHPLPGREDGRQFTIPLCIRDGRPAFGGVLDAVDQPAHSVRSVRTVHCPGRSKGVTQDAAARSDHLDIRSAAVAILPCGRLKIAQVRDDRLPGSLALSDRRQHFGRDHRRHPRPEIGWVIHCCPAPRLMMHADLQREPDTPHQHGAGFVSATQHLHRPCNSPRAYAGREAVSTFRRPPPRLCSGLDRSGRFVGNRARFGRGPRSGAGPGRAGPQVRIGRIKAGPASAPEPLASHWA